MKEAAIRELKLLEVRRMAADSLRLRRRELEVDALAPGGYRYDNTPVMGGGSDPQERLINTIDRCDTLQKKETALREMVAQTERAISALLPRHRTVLDALYVHPKSNPITWLQAHLYLSRTQVYRVREEALTQFAMLMGHGI